MLEMTQPGAGRAAGEALIGSFEGRARIAIRLSDEKSASDVLLTPGAYERQ